MVLYDRVEPRFGFAEHVPVVLLGHHYRTAFTVVAASYAEVDIQSCFLERKSDGSDFLSGLRCPAPVAVVRLERGGQRVVLGNMVGDAVLQGIVHLRPPGTHPVVEGSHRLPVLLAFLLLRDAGVPLDIYLDGIPLALAAAVPIAVPGHPFCMCSHIPVICLSQR